MKVTDTKCIDSSAWLAYYFGESNKIKFAIENEEFLIITSCLAIFEIKKKLIKLKKDCKKFRFCKRKRKNYCY